MVDILLTTIFKIFLNVYQKPEKYTFKNDRYFVNWDFLIFLNVYKKPQKYSLKNDRYLVKIHFLNFPKHLPATL